MKKVRGRTKLLLILALILVAGMGVFLFRLVRDGRQWVSFPANQAVYSDGVLTVGTLTDRNGTVLAGVSDGQRTYAAYESVRRGCLHVVGDESDNIGTGALTAFASRLIGYNLITGTYSLKGEGRSLALSVDADLSAAALEALEGYRGTVLVCNYKTGEILCDVSLPAYDPADPPEDFTDEAYEGVFINRGLSARYTPGSVFKIVTLAAAIDNIEDLFDRTFTCEGETLIGDDTVTCTGYHGEQTIEEAFANSCNCVFGQLALELGPEVLSRYAQRCGLTEPYFIDGIETASGSFEQAAPDSADLAWSGIGQYRDTVVPVEMLRLVCAVANEGQAPELTLLKRSGVKLFADVKTQQLLFPDTARRIGEMMSYNVAYTYGSENYPGLSLHAKSGTAEVGADANPHAWFVGYIDDADHPLAFVVIAENGGWGSSTAGAIANTVLQAAVGS